MQALPPAGGSNRESCPWQGRKLLTFADNRQNAAYFAPYFERTSFELALRSAVCQVISAGSLPLDFEALTLEVFQYWKQFADPLLIDEDGSQIHGWEKIRHLLMGKIAAEFCTPGGRRNSLEALGAVHVSYEESVLERLSKHTANTLPVIYDEARALVHFLLETMRREKAISNLERWTCDWHGYGVKGTKDIAVLVCTQEATGPSTGFPQRVLNETTDERHI